MNILIHPTYFPNIAHFTAMVNAENIMLEIDDNYQKQTYRNRAYIYGANGLLPLSIPVIYSQNNRQKYRDVKISNTTKWQSLHWKSLQSAYSTSPFFEFYVDELKPLFHLKSEFLLEYNLRCFDAICECLQLDLKISKTESYQKIVEYKTDLRYLVNAKKEMPLQLDSYTQVFDDKCGFISNLSILDLLFNEGPNALLYLEAQNLTVK